MGSEIMDTYLLSLTLAPVKSSCHGIAVQNAGARGDTQPRRRSDESNSI
jgi:hypothetical protein